MITFRHFWISVFIFNLGNLSANDSIHVELGIPISIDSTPFIQIRRAQYWVNYKPLHGNPEWVAWNVNKN